MVRMTERPREYGELRGADREEFLRQMEQIRPQLENMAQRLVGSADAEDIVQSAIMKTWAAADRLSGPDCYSKWAVRATRTTALNMLQSAERRHAVPSDLNRLGFDPPRAVSSAEEAALGVLDGEQVRDTLQRMDRDRAEIIYQRDGLGVEYEDLQRSHGLSSNQLRNRLHRARADFRKKFVRVSCTVFPFLRVTGGAHTVAGATSMPAAIGSWGAAAAAVGLAVTGVVVANTGGAPIPRPEMTQVAQILPATSATSSPSPSISPTTIPSAAAPSTPVTSRSTHASPSPKVTQTDPAPAREIAKPVTAPRRAPVTSPAPQPQPVVVPPAPVAVEQPVPAPSPVAPPSPSPSEIATLTGTAVCVGTFGVSGVDYNQVSGIVEWRVVNTSDQPARITPASGTVDGSTVVPAHGQVTWGQTLPAAPDSVWAWSASNGTLSTSVSLTYNQVKALPTSGCGGANWPS